ncbi:cell division protein FtsK, partial [Bacillus toyonensis]
GLETLPSIAGRALFKTDRIEEIQVPYLSNKEMWSALKQYKVVKHYETPKIEAKSETNRDFIEFK